MVYAPLESYQKAQFSTKIAPEKVVLVLYETAIQRLHLAKDGLEKNDPKKRGENISKTIAIISHLNASRDTSGNAEELKFLEGLYVAMMMELTKVAVTKDMKTVDRAIGYLSELKRIWEATAMKTPEKQSRQTVPDPGQYKAPQGYAAGSGSNYTRHHSITI